MRADGAVYDAAFTFYLTLARFTNADSERSGLLHAALPLRHGPMPMTHPCLASLTTALTPGEICSGKNFHFSRRKPPQAQVCAR